MKPAVILSRFSLDSATPEQVAAFRSNVAALLQKTKGFRDTSVWVRDGAPWSHAILTSFDSRQTAAHWLDEVAQSGLVEQAVEIYSGPPNLLCLELHVEMGQGPSSEFNNEWLSISDRLMSPGLGKRQVKELHAMFDELRFIEGFRGFWVGVNASLTDEVVGLAFWSNRAAFDRSMPANPMFKVQVYERLQLQ